MKKILLKNNESVANIELLDSHIKEDLTIEKSLDDLINDNESDTGQKIDYKQSKKNSNILSYIVVFIISFIAIIIILDTFQSPIGKLVPNLEFFLYNLYETINDVKLFLKDLI